MELQSLKKTGIFLFVAAILLSAAPCTELLAAEEYPLVYKDIYAQREDYMALTEIGEDYTVLPGDSLWTIAEEQLGDGNFYLELADMNQEILTDPDLIYPGMCLKVSRTGYIRYRHKEEPLLGSIQMGQYTMASPYGWTIGTTQSGNAGGNFVLSGDGSIACLIQDKTEDTQTSVLDWPECTRQIAAYAEKNYPEQVSELHFEHYRMEEQGDASGDLYLYSYLWHISPADYPELTCQVCIGLKLTDHIQAEFVGYTLDDYDIKGCVRYVTASFEEHFDVMAPGTFTVNGSNMSIVPETEWPLTGMYNSFAYMDEFFTALLEKAMKADTETKKSRYDITR